MLTDDLQNLKCTKLNYINLLFLKNSLSKNGHELLLLKENPELFLLNARFECVIPLHKILQCCPFTQGKSQRTFTIWPLFNLSDLIFRNHFTYSTSTTLSSSIYFSKTQAYFEPQSLVYYLSGTLFPSNIYMIHSLMFFRSLLKCLLCSKVYPNILT